MTYLKSVLSQESLKRVILELYHHLNGDHSTIEDNTNATGHLELTELLFAYLQKYNVHPDMLEVCKYVLSGDQVIKLKKVNPYNYHKLILSIKYFKDHVQDNNTGTELPLQEQ